MQLIGYLDNYKGSKGATYKDDYRAILSWVISKYQEEKLKSKAKQSDSDTDNIFLKIGREGF